MKTDARAEAAGDQRSIAMRPFDVERLVQRFGDERPLHGHVVEAVLGFAKRVVHGQRLVHGPARRDVIEDDAAAAVHPDGVALRAPLVPEARADVANHHVVGFDDQGLVANRDAIARRALAGDGDARMTNGQRRRQGNRAGDVEDHGARAGGFDSRAQTTGACVVEIGDLEHAPGAAAQRESPGTFRARKGERFDWWLRARVGFCRCGEGARRDARDDVRTHLQIAWYLKFRKRTLPSPEA